MASSLVKGVPYKIFICLKSVLLPDSPAPKIRSLILRDSAAQLWVSERESCGWGDCVDGGAVASGVARRRRDAGASMAWDVVWARHRRGTRGRTRAGVACGLWVGPRRRARGRASKKTPSRTSLSLLPQPPSSSATEAPQPMFVPPGCFLARARARSRFFAARRLSVDVSRLLLASAAPAGPRRRRQDAQGAAQAGGKTLRTISH